MEVFVFGFIVGAVVLFLVMVAVGDWQSNQVPKFLHHWECNYCPMVLDYTTREGLNQAIVDHMHLAHNLSEATRRAS